MAVTLTVTPTYPVAKRKLYATIGLTGGGNYARIWCTDAPQGSGLRGVLDEGVVSRVQVYEGGTVDRWEFTPDVGGVYVLTAQEYTRGASTTGGGYEDAPETAPSETKIGSESALTLRVGQRVLVKLGAGQDAAQLVTYVVDGTFRPTTLADHGEKSPAIVDANSPRAKYAALNATVQSFALTNSNATVSSVIGAVSTMVTDFIDKYNAHRTLVGGVHNAADTVNVIADEFRLPASPKGLVTSIAECVRILERHMRNDSGSGDGSGSFHQVSSKDCIDWTNLIPEPMRAVPDVAQALVSFGAVVGAYEAHRVSLVVHGIADGTNSIGALSTFVSMHRAWADVVKAQSPTAPSTENSGAVLLLAYGGIEG